MTKKERQSYDRRIDEIADKQIIGAYRNALEVTDGVYLDILLRMRTKIDSQIEYIQQRNAERQKTKPLAR